MRLSPEEEFRRLDQGMLKFLLNIAKDTVPETTHLQGRVSARTALQENRVTDQETVKAVMKDSFGFSEFQQASLYDSQGYFETKVDFKKGSMPLLPQLLCPFLGRSIAEMTFALYTHHAYPFAQDPTFLGLGAGRGILDYDLISHLTARVFDLPEHKMFAQAVRDNSRFIVSDRTARSRSLLEEELSPLLKDPRLQGRIEIAKIDANNFGIGPHDFGVIYFNEMIDNMPTEPVLKIDDTLYGIRIVGFGPIGEDEKTSESRYLEAKLGIPHLMPKELILARLKNGHNDCVKFRSMFVPVEYYPYLTEKVKEVSSTLPNIDSPDFGGIYPINTELDGLFSSIRESFKKGLIIAMDYTPSGQGQHNWNMAVNAFKDYRFGDEDIDFQIDPDQVIAKARSHGIELHTAGSLQDHLKESLSLINLFKEEDFERGLSVNGAHRSEDEKTRLLYCYGCGITFADRYCLLGLTFDSE